LAISAYASHACPGFERAWRAVFFLPQVISVVVVGVANMLEPYRDRVVVAELDSERSVKDTVDIALYDSFAQPESDQQQIKVLVDNPRARRVVVYTWNFHPELVRAARDLGVHGYLSKALSARELVAALEAVHAGEIVVSESATRARTVSGLDWPGRREGLTDRESEILALITQGKSNTEIAGLTYLSLNTIKSYIRNLYRKIDVDSRTRAVLWGVRNGFLPDHHRIEHWRGGP
jgi:DNA-binding NarL/FixJ family response regulator